jgi:hypothetical protein
MEHAMTANWPRHKAKASQKTNNRRRKIAELAKEQLERQRNDLCVNQ